MLLWQSRSAPLSLSLRLGHGSRFGRCRALQSQPQPLVLHKELEMVLRYLYAALSALLASLGGLLFGYDQGVLAGVLVMRDFEYRFGLGRWGEGVVSESDPLLVFPVFVRTRC